MISKSDSSPASTTQDAAAPRLTVWYDAQCPLCVREIAWMRKLDRDRAIEFISAYQASDCPLSQKALLARMHARDSAGVYLSGAAAFAAMWRVLPGLRPFGWAAQWPPVLKGLEWAYLRFLRVRPALQRWVRNLGMA